MSLFEQPIPFNPDEFDIKKYMDLNNIKTITYDEILQDVNKFKLSGVPLIDMICVKHFGDFLNNKFCCDKWQICPNIILQIYTELNDKLPECNIQFKDIELYINKLRKDNADVQSIDVKIEIYMTDYLRSLYWTDKSNEDKIKKYFVSKGIVNNIMKQIKLQYECDWNEIEQQFEDIQDILSKNFDETEEDPKYIAAESLLEKINNDACKYIDPIRNNIVDKIKSEYQKNVIIKSISEFNNFQTIFNKLKNKFSDEVEKVYQKVLIDNKIDKHIQSYILEMFVLEKSMHAFNLSLDLTELTLLSCSANLKTP
jgi:hypothetical protein